MNERGISHGFEKEVSSQVLIYFLFIEIFRSIKKESSLPIQARPSRPQPIVFCASQVLSKQPPIGTASLLQCFTASLPPFSFKTISQWPVCKKGEGGLVSHFFIQFDYFALKNSLISIFGSLSVFSGLNSVITDKLLTTFLFCLESDVNMRQNSILSHTEFQLGSR